LLVFFPFPHWWQATPGEQCSMGNGWEAII
jgi:hypothetical protein